MLSQQAALGLDLDVGIDLGQDEELGALSIAPAASEPDQTLTTEVTARLFDEWAFGLSRGEWSEPHDYLERAGANADELRLLMDIYIRALPRPTPTEDDIEQAQGWLAARSFDIPLA
jgi:hypothetical protein